MWKLLDNFWRNLSQTLFSPTLNEQEVAERLAAVKQNLPVPVFWLLGKAQSGKTSIIKALTRRNEVEIGNGFQPCTKQAWLYDFPDTEHSFIRFLDTRGLGEVDYDPREDIRLFERQSHVLIVVMKVGDQAQQPVLQALQSILKSHPDWPVLVAQTCLHELYPRREMEHLLPYPYEQTPLPPEVPAQLRAALLNQRQWFASMPNVHFAAVDFTRAEENYAPVDYGLESLWTRIEQIFPWGIRAFIQGTTADVYNAAAHPHIIAYSLAAGGLEAIPLPAASVPLVLAVQAKMFQTLASLYNQKLTPDRFTEIAAVLGTGYLLRLLGRQAIKFIPVYGQAVTAVYSAATTFALGKALCVYFSKIQQGDVATDAEIQAVFAKEFDRAKEILQPYFKNVLK